MDDHSFTQKMIDEAIMLAIYDKPAEASAYALIAIAESLKKIVEAREPSI